MFGERLFYKNDDIWDGLMSGFIRFENCQP